MVRVKVHCRQDIHKAHVVEIRSDIIVLPFSCIASPVKYVPTAGIGDFSDPLVSYTKMHFSNLNLG